MANPCAHSRSLLLALLLALSALGTSACTHDQAPRGAVAADHILASEAGARILRAGGNAVDAAVATSFALSVVRPYSCGIGGGGFMLVHLADDPTTPEGGDALSVAIDYRERAPAAITPTHFESLPEGASQFSGHAVAIPGTVAGLLHALDRYGTLDRAAVLAPAIEYAERGFEVDQHTLDAIGALREFLEAQGDAWPGAAFLRETYVEHERLGALIRNPAQARALRLIAEDGRAAFYEGPIAEAVAMTVERAGGVLDRSDLASYRVTTTEPLVGEAFGRTFLCMPLPSSGGICLLEMALMLETRSDLLASTSHNDVRYAHLLTEVSKHAFADRAAHLADPEFVAIDTDRLVDPRELRSRAATIDMGTTHDPSFYGIDGQIPVDAGTSHLSVVDRWGNAVACTETINLEFGCRIPVVEFGFLLNNEMDDFLTRRGEVNAFGLTQSERNLPAPGKRPLSSMSPTIVLDASGGVEIAAGASSGPRIISGTFQAILNVMLWDMDARSAVGEPRFHHQWMPNAIYLEPGLYEDAALVAGLEGLGHEVRARPRVGYVQLIRRDGSGWDAASDRRKDGVAAWE